MLHRSGFRRHRPRPSAAGLLLALVAALVTAPAASALPSEGPARQSVEGLVSGSFSAGSAHGCGVRSDGSVACIGRNDNGEAPPVVEGTFKQISAGDKLTCALRTNGFVTCWGKDTQGSTAAPSGFFTQVSAGTYHACGVRGDATVACWGYNGRPNQFESAVHQGLGMATPPSGTFTHVAVGESRSCGLGTNGQMSCWGISATEALYDGGRLQPDASYLYAGTNAQVADFCTLLPVGVVDCQEGRQEPGIFTQISEGKAQFRYGCGRRPNAELVCYGSTGFSASGVFRDISAGSGDRFGQGASEIFAGWICGVRGDSAATCWRSPETPGGPTTTLPGPFANRAIDAGARQNCAVRPEGAVVCWSAPGEPAPAAPAAGAYRQVSAAAEHGCGVKVDGSVSCWGNDASGQVSGVPAGTYIQVSAGGAHSCAVRTGGGTVACWGRAGHTPPPSGAFAQVSAGSVHSCGVKVDGSVACWGDERDGRAPATVPGSFNQVSAGEDDSCGVRVNGTIACWGLHTTGGSNQTPPWPVPPDRFTQVSVGRSHACALRLDGVIACWGGANTGEQAPRTMPGTFTQVSAAAGHSCGVKASGAAECWGSDGVLGPAFSSTPPPGGSVGVGYVHTFATTSSPRPAVRLDSGTLPPGLTLVGATGALSGTPTQAGTFTGTVRAAEEFFPPGAAQAFSITIATNDSPIAVGDAPTTYEDIATTFDVLANDTDADGGRKEITAVTQPSHATVSVAGGGSRVLYTPAPNYCNSGAGGEPDTFTYTLNGGSTATVSVLVVCRFDDPPVAVDDAVTVEEDSMTTFFDVFANDSDAERIASVSAASHGASGLWWDRTEVYYSPAQDYCNSTGDAPPDTFTYTLHGGTTATVSVTVTCVDDDPRAVDDRIFVRADDFAMPFYVTRNDVDPEGDPTTITGVTQPAGGEVFKAQDGSFVTYQPRAGTCNTQAGGAPDTFTYTLNGGSEATVSVEVLCDSPPTAEDDELTLYEDAYAARVDVLENDRDPEGDRMTIESLTQPRDGRAILGSNGISLSYEPAPDACSADPESVPDTFTYTINGGSEATVSILVLCVDDPPTAVDDDVSVDEDSGATPVDLLGNDADVDAGPRTVVSATEPANGSVEVREDGSGVTFAPAAGFCGPDRFAYELNGGSTATVSVTVRCVDDAPVAIADAATVDEDAAALAIDVLENDTDVDGGPRSVASLQQPRNGTAVRDQGGSGLTYAPAADFCGADVFGYELAGGSTATVSVTVRCVDDRPTAIADAATLAQGAGLTALDVLANDTDPDGGPRSIASVTQPANGTAATGQAGALIYGPRAAFCGRDLFSYTLDGGSEATVAVTVTCALDRTAPATRITRRPKATVRTRAASALVRFAFRSSEPGSRFECRLGKTPFRRCSGPKRYRLRPGRHVFAVRATDAAGNRDRTPATFAVRVVRRR